MENGRQRMKAGRRGLLALLLMTAASAGAWSVSVSAQATSAVRIVQWPVFYAIGSDVRIDTTGEPGTESPAGTLWATTRQNDPKLIRLVPGAVPDTVEAAWTAWPLISGEHNAEGVAITPDDQVFVRTTIGLLRIDPATNTRTLWADVGGKSDLALAPNGCVWSALPLGPLQCLYPQSRNSANALVTEWPVGGSGEISLAGVAVYPTSGLVYFSDNGSDLIGELEPVTGRVRRWSLAPVGAARPRNISIDRTGDVWAVTRTNHVIRLRPSTNELTAFLIPSAGSDPYGIAADGLIAFTETGLGRIGFLIPTGSPMVVPPVVAKVSPTLYGNAGWMDTVQPLQDTAMPIVTQMPTTAVDVAGTGHFIEAPVPLSAGALGIDRNPTDPAGTFYFADYGQRVIGRVSLPVPEEALVTGGGWIDVPGGKASFGFTAYRPEAGAPVKGHLRFRNHATGDTIDSVEINDLLVYGSNATFTGLIDIGGGALGPFTVRVSDQGEPGSGDTFRILAGTGSSAGNTLGGGNIQIHRQK